MENQRREGNGSCNFFPYEELMHLLDHITDFILNFRHLYTFQFHAVSSKIALQFLELSNSLHLMF